MKVLSLNLHKGFSLFNRRFVLLELREAIRNIGADLVLLQEVQGSYRSRQKNKSPEEIHSKSQYEYLADEVWSDFAYAQNAIYEDGHHGNAILSKFPILSYDNLDLTVNKREKRGLLHARIDNSPSHLGVFSLHLNLLQNDRLKQIQMMKDYLQEKCLEDPFLILGGDFNDWTLALDPLLREIGLKEAHFEIHQNHAQTFPAAFPKLRLDRIYVRGFEVQHAEVLSDNPWRDLSDHLPLLVDLKALS